MSSEIEINSRENRIRKEAFDLGKLASQISQLKKYVHAARGCGSIPYQDAFDELGFDEDTIHKDLTMIVVSIYERYAIEKQ